MFEGKTEVRIAADVDLPGILKVNAFFTNPYSHTEEFFREGISFGHVLVACTPSNDVIGYAIYEVLWGNTPFLSLVRVIPSEQGRGVGRTIMAALEKRLKDQKYPALISSSEESNASGSAYHEKMGFRSIGTLEMIYGREVFYRKDLK